MSDSTTPTTPAGWYADPAGGTRVRWWDGAQWTEHYQEAYAPAAAAAELKAPEGTRTNTVWVWLVVLLPLLPLIALLTVDWGSYFTLDVNDPMSAYSSLGMIASPGYLIATFGGWIVYGLCVLFAYLDWKQLGAAGVPRPFHWAWAFLSSIVYVIGRSVVVRRRTGRGAEPMWVAIGTIVVSFGIAIYIVVAIVASIMTTIEFAQY